MFLLCGCFYIVYIALSKTGRMQQASQKEVTRGELESMVMEENYLYETVDPGNGRRIERSQTAGDEAYSDGPPVCEVYETVDESGGINPCKCKTLSSTL